MGTTAAVVQTSTAGDSSAPNGVRMYSGSLTGNIGSGTTDEGENILISPSTLIQEQINLLPLDMYLQVRLIPCI